MRVLFLTHNYPRTTGDASGSFILRLAKALKAELVKYQRPEGIMMDSSSWKVTARNP